MRCHYFFDGTKILPPMMILIPKDHLRVYFLNNAVAISKIESYAIRIHEMLISKEKFSMY